MRNESHSQTFIGLLREAVEQWRKDNGWSRETAVMHIVETHDRMNGPSTTGIAFDPPTRDPFERAKVNADRVFRWLDDVTKDTNTCPPNFIQSILVALPLDRRLTLLNRWLVPLDITCRPVRSTDEASDSTLAVFRTLMKESADAQTSMANLLDGIDPGELEQAHTELCEARGAIDNAIALTESKLAGTTS